MNRGKFVTFMLVPDMVKLMSEQLKGFTRTIRWPIPTCTILTKEDQHQHYIGIIHVNLSHLMRLWHFSSSVNFKRVGLDIWLSGRTLRLIPYFVCANSEDPQLVRLCGCAGSPEPLLVAYVISTIISWTGSYNVFKHQLETRRWNLWNPTLKRNSNYGWSS